MALVVTQSHMNRHLWREDYPEDLINVFLKMWDGKVRFWVEREIGRLFGSSDDDSPILSQIHRIFLSRLSVA